MRTDDRQIPLVSIALAAVASPVIVSGVANVVTHIAPADDKQEIICSPVVAHGVIHYAMKELGLCAGITGARYTSTTEVYPDSPRATPAQCIAAQVAAVCAAVEFVLAQK